MRTFLTIFWLLVWSFQGSSQTEIWRVEPQNWWVGMTNSELQIMIHGKEVSSHNPVIDYPGVTINRIERTTNQNYLFIYLTIHPETPPGELTIHLSENRIGFPLVERYEGSAQREGFGTEDVIYLITPDRFANGDTSNDEFVDMEDKRLRTNPYGRHGGDLRGIINHLDYIDEMGFTAIWLNPVVENNMPSQSYHGYASTDFYAIDKRFGTLEDYLELSEKCNERGIRLIMDQIMNHCGSNHWWMADLPDEDWINSLSTYRQTSHQRVVLNDPYAAKSDIHKLTEGWFVPTMPDLNQNHPLLGDYLIQNSIWWVEAAGLGGIRHDTHPYAGKDFMRDYSCSIMAEYPNFTIVGEEWSNNPAVIAKWQKNKNNPDGFESCMPSMFDFPLQTAMTQALNEPETWNSGWTKLYEALSNDFLYADPFMLVTFPDNHDMDRFFTQVGEDFNKFKMGMAYMACMRGIPQFYYGTEILMTNDVPGHHGLIRSDFPGGWPDDSKNAFSRQGLTAEEIEAQNFVKKLLNWRKNSQPVHLGRLMHYAPENSIYTFVRYLDNEAVMVIFNKGNIPIRILPEQYPEMLMQAKKGYEVLTDREIDLSGFVCPPESVQIIEFNLEDK